MICKEEMKASLEVAKNNFLNSKVDSPEEHFFYQIWQDIKESIENFEQRQVNFNRVPF